MIILKIYIYIYSESISVTGMTKNVKYARSQREELCPWQRSWGRRLGIHKGRIEPKESPWKLSSIYPQNQSLPTLLLCALTSDFTGGCPPPPSRSLWNGVNLQLQLIKFLAIAAKSLQSCLTLCDPIDGSPPGSAIPGILQARILEWVAISFSNAGKWKVKSDVAQSCPTLRDPMNGSLPGFFAHGIFQARVLEWGAIAFSVHACYIYTMEY